LLQEKREEWLESGATGEALGALQDFAGCELPADYVDFLRLSDGFLNLRGSESALHASRLFAEFLPGALVIGGDGGEGRYLLDLRSGASSAGEYVYIPMEHLEWNQAARRWQDFESFFLEVVPQAPSDTGG